MKLISNHNQIETIITSKSKTMQYIISKLHEFKFYIFSWQFYGYLSQQQNMMQVNETVLELLFERSSDL